MDDPRRKIVEEISRNHSKIIDDWCKAYLAQLYEENGSIKPGDFVLVEQRLDCIEGKIEKKYWFEKRKENENEMEIS